MMVTDELDECRGVRFPIFRKALQIFENGDETGGRKQANRILGIFVEVGVENAHVLEIGFSPDIEKVPSEVMQLENGEDVRLTSHGLLDVLGVLIENRLPSWDDLRDDGEAVASRSLGKDRAVSALLNFILEETPFGDRHRRGLRPVALPRCVRHNFLLSILALAGIVMTEVASLAATVTVFRPATTRPGMALPLPGLGRTHRTRHPIS